MMEDVGKKGITKKEPNTWNLEKYGKEGAFFLSFNFLIGWQLFIWNCCNLCGVVSYPPSGASPGARSMNAV